MIPHGLTPANDARAAAIFGISPKRWQTAKRWKDQPGLRVLSREDAMRRLYAEEQLTVAKTNADRRDQDKPPLPMPGIPAPGHDLDLLDLDEARLSLPKERQVSSATWTRYRSPSSPTRLPAPDHTETGEDLWFRKTIADWDANRTQHRGPSKGQGGRPAGSKDSKSKEWGSTAKKRARVAELLTAHGSELTAADVQEEFGGSLRTAERLLTEARQKAAEQLAEQDDVSPDEARRQVGLISEAERRAEHIRALLEEKGPALTASTAAASLGIGIRQAAEALRQVRLDKIREARAKKVRVTERWIAETFGVKPDLAQYLLKESRTTSRTAAGR
ncbi:hypothetical protein [Streptomyces sp. NPDC056672]|uniref:hypothetical protein n=1 Tax=Streptomyces sp. NPDC056672 TaxID=3345906 RepID=UPI0036BE5E55